MCFLKLTPLISGYLQFGNKCVNQSLHGISGIFFLRFLRYRVTVMRVEAAIVTAIDIE